MSKIIYTQVELPEIARELLELIPKGILAFYGPMGAGKTTLIKALVKELDGKDEASSPTFGIVNEYHTKAGALLGYHFDFYRLNKTTEALDMGIEDYFAVDAWQFIEWPEKIEALLPPAITKIYIELVDENTRQITVQHK
ncbi:MAG: tRNA (adenosine(37)-N6)-threonylcarbamoyltransferase complex ATPase subunit type 1 TsaE [Eudoraea sp.]|nr:tRNA (adenosine(37)-N6)-threonylcarbamoyltransferase complex ATPase subunit type 1 TsaE [Eudoraea sp.]